ncbi:hypothetical protein F7725_010378 [Dissostichus mawsoni]|uniref:Uncharacterized protein n=1 Tax=Dissostichus mawsoni TaxID=36200 RepID=A0A7J5XNN3_DISMA|nr:hypothetical protein F7725_010378 [Dissostichus mawsoni]
MTRRPTDQSRRPCLLPCLEGGVTTESMRAERPPTLKQQAPPHTSNPKWAWRSRMKTCKGRLMAEGGAPYG